MPRWRTDETPEEAYSNFPAMVILMAMIVIVAIMIYRGDLNPSHAQARVFVPMPPDMAINSSK